MTKQKTIMELQAQLDEVIAWFESDEVDIDKAIVKFKQGQELVAELQNRLKDVELQVKKIQPK